MLHRDKQGGGVTISSAEQEDWQALESSLQAANIAVGWREHWRHFLLILSAFAFKPEGGFAVTRDGLATPIRLKGPCYAYVKRSLWMCLIPYTPTLTTLVVTHPEMAAGV